MFLKIGDLYINQDHIESIEVTGNTIEFFGAGHPEGEQPMYSFGEPEYQAILNWLKYRAEVSVVY